MARAAGRVPASLAKEGQSEKEKLGVSFERGSTSKHNRTPQGPLKKFVKPCQRQPFQDKQLGPRASVFSVAPATTSARWGQNG